MRAQNIKIKQFELLDLLEYRGIQEINEHGTVSISGHIREEKEQEYLKMFFNDLWVDIVAIEEEEEKILFSGIVAEGRIQSQNHVKTLYLEVKTSSYLMDREKHIRSYQKESLTYEDILNSFSDNYIEYVFIMEHGKGKTIDNFICQYGETDWTFAKRLASHFSTCLVPNHTLQGVKYSFGLPQRNKNIELKNNEYTIKKENGITYYIVKDREIYHLGDIVSFQGRNFSIIKIESELEGKELVHFYSLVVREAVQVAPIYNTNMIGASLEGRVLSVQKDKIQVSIFQDENKNKTGERLFEYATIYSTPDGTGWYCMPEIGDNVRIYFPSEKEKEAYAVSSTHIKTSNVEERINPDYKSIMNKQGKEVLLKPDEIILTNNAGMSVELSDREGIKIISNKEILIKSEEAIDISSTNSELQIFAPNAIVLNQGSTQMKLSDNLVMKGARVQIE